MVLAKVVFCVDSLPSTDPYVKGDFFQDVVSGQLNPLRAVTVAELPSYKVASCVSYCLSKLRCGGVRDKKSPVDLNESGIGDIIGANNPPRSLERFAIEDRLKIS